MALFVEGSSNGMTLSSPPLPVCEDEDDDYAAWSGMYEMYSILKQKGCLWGFMPLILWSKW